MPKSSFSSLLRTGLRDAPRILAIVVAVILTIWLSGWLPKAVGLPELAPLLTTVYVVLILIAFGHFARRALFHKLDLQGIGLRALDSPIGAGMVFIGICLVLCTILLCYVQLLR